MKKTKMKMITGAILLAMTLTGCSTKAEAKNPSPAEHLVSTYYSGQESDAYRMFKKSIFKKMVSGWTGGELQNPVWNYDSFARYYILDQDLAPSMSDQELYYCTYSDDNDKSGYVVLLYS